MVYKYTRRNWEPAKKKRLPEAVCAALVLLVSSLAVLGAFNPAVCDNINGRAMVGTIFFFFVAISFCNDKARIADLVASVALFGLVLVKLISSYPDRYRTLLLRLFQTNDAQVLAGRIGLLPHQRSVSTIMLGVMVNPPLVNAPSPAPPAPPNTYVLGLPRCMVKGLH